MFVYSITLKQKNNKKKRAKVYAPWILWHEMLAFWVVNHTQEFREASRSRSEVSMLAVWAVGVQVLPAVTPHR